jgi:hypothetical protein
MKTMILAMAAMLSLGAGAAYADGSDSENDATIPNTFFTELPGVVATAPGARPNNAAPVASQAVGQPTTTTLVTPPAGRANGG